MYSTTAVVIASLWGQRGAGFTWFREMLRENMAGIRQKCRGVKKSVTTGLDWCGQWKWEWRVCVWNLNLEFLWLEMSD